MKYAISLFILILFVCCKSHSDIGMDDICFFETYFLKTNRNFSIDSINFEEDFFNSHFPELGTIKTPQTRFDVKYDTTSRYVVELKGSINFKKNKFKYETKDIKSVSLIHMSIWKLSNQRKRWEYDKDSIISPNNCPIPKDYLNSIKKNFFFVNSQRVINVKNQDSKCNSFPVVRTYKLY